MAVDWEIKYGDKVDFFKHAQEMGIAIPAMESQPSLSLEEQFFISSFSILSTASYSCISQYCKDYNLSIEEKSDLIVVINRLNAHLKEGNKNANTRTNTGRKRVNNRG